MATAGRRDGTAGLRAVEVAIDAAGRGGDRTFTYLVPPALADLVPGEAVLVEFGRRQALGVILAEADATADGRGQADRRPDPGRRSAPAAPDPRAGALDRRPLSRAAGPRPPGDAAAGTPRAARPGRRARAWGRDPGPTPGVADDPADADLLAQLERGPRPVRDLAGPDGRAGPAAPPAGDGRHRPGQPRVDAERRRLGPAL